MEAEDKAFLLKLRDTAMAAIDESRFSQVVGRLQESMAVCCDWHNNRILHSTPFLLRVSVRGRVLFICLQGENQQKG